MEFNEDQKEAIDFYKGCCNVIASAGSGKTWVLVNRIANLINTYHVSAQNILAITFSKKAKDNIKDRLDKLIPFQSQSVYVETFHSLGYKICKMFSGTNYKLISYDWQKQKILNDIYRSKYYDNEMENINDVLNYISIRKNNLIKPNQSVKVDDKEFNWFYEQYELAKQKKKVMDFDDMLTMSYEILNTNKSALDYCQNQFQFILVDEVQDINKVQYKIIKLIAQKNQNLFVVGDMLQNIFEWRGSSNKFVINFQNDWENVKTINLNTNYRSSKDIVDFANYFAQNLPESKISDYKDSIADKSIFKKPEYKIYKNEFEEANGISKKINELVSSESYNYNDIAILARTNAQLQNFETALFDNGLPYQIVDGTTFTDRKEIKIILSYLLLADNLNDNESFEYVYNKPNRWLGKKFLDEVSTIAKNKKMSLYCAMFKIDRRNWKFKKGIDEICTVINHLRETEFKSVKYQIKYLRDKLKIDEYVSSDINEDQIDSDKIENLNSLEHIASKYKDVKSFIDYINSLSKENNKKQNGVLLMTIHKAKGLEFPVVFLVGLNQGILPHRLNDNINEEMRLTYVAITRAESELYCSSTKSMYGKSMDESQFVKLMFDIKKKKRHKKHIN
jgi:DNA helicase-2/ATP-dependent DNA helicase PcrA